MTKDLKTIDLNLLPIETLKEMANEAGEQVENNAKQTVHKAADCGRYLIAIKDQCEPGKWLEWLGANWNYTRRTATRYMEIAEHGTRMSHLKDASSINEALRMIADDKEEKTAPRDKRKPADVVVSKPSEKPPEPQQGYRADSRAATTEPTDPDPTPDPPTQRKTAKGSEKVSEDKKQKTATITPEILSDDQPDPVAAADRTGRIIDAFVIQCDIEKFLQLKADAGLIGDGKRAAKALRKLADKLDPPTKFVKPDLDEVSEYFRELNAVDPDSFFDFYESKGWLVGKVSMKNWQASARKWVRENQSNGKANSNGSATRNGGSRGLTADEVFSAESMGRGR